jgi:glycosyltransferase involved in cell wall biosynthesis
VWVVDSGSTDRTEEIVRELGCDFVYQPWLGYARQKNWALDNLDLKADWILIVDADEAVQEDLKTLMAEAAGKEFEEGDPVAYYINRYFIFLGKRIRHCGYYPSWNIRFFKRGTTRYEERNVHEHMVPKGPKEYMHGHLEHYDRRSLQNYMAKHNKYSTLEAVEIYKWIKGQSTEETEARLFGTPLERRRWIKHYIYPGLPVKWLFRFVFMYFVKLGFLDGLNGFRFSLFITAYELLIDLKLREIKLMEKEGRLDLEAYASE